MWVLNSPDHHSPLYIPKTSFVTFWLLATISSYFQFALKCSHLMHALPISIPQNNHISVAFYDLSGKFLTFIATHEVILSLCTWLSFFKIPFTFPLRLRTSVSQFLWFDIIASRSFLSAWRWCPRCVNHILGWPFYLPPCIPSLNRMLTLFLILYKENYIKKIRFEYNHRNFETVTSS